MFGTKPEGFKYKNEVKALIREATMELNQRILELETQNRQLTHELYQIKNGVVNDFQVVDRHMTELANMWHPMLMQNINRIQADLETTIRAEREGVKKVQEELEQKMAIIAEERLMDNVLVGYHNGFPIFVHKDSDIEEIWKKFLGGEGNSYRSHLNNTMFIFESLRHCKSAYFDPARFLNMTIINKNGVITNSLRKTPTEYHGCLAWDDSLLKTHEVKNLYKLCQEYGIKFVINGQDNVGGIPIKIMFTE
jgi:BMFP domain-containing protein YqiC